MPTWSTREIPTFVSLPSTATILLFPNSFRKPWLGMIRVHFQVGEEERLSAGLLASAIGLDRHEDGIDLFQLFRIIEFHHPSLFGGAVLVEDAKAGSLLFVETAAAPRLKGAG